MIHPSTRPQEPPTTGNAKSAAAARFHATRLDGQNVTRPWTQTTTAKLAYPPIPSATHKGQWGPRELCTLHESAAPSHQERQPQSNKRSQALMKSADVIPAATRNMAALVNSVGRTIGMVTTPCCARYSAAGGTAVPYLNCTRADLPKHADCFQSGMTDYSIPPVKWYLPEISRRSTFVILTVMRSP